MWLSILLVVVGLLWLLLAVMAGKNILAAPPLPAAEVVDRWPQEASLPKVSVIMAARDEGARLAQSLQRMFEQQGVELEVIAVDDRSRDDTPRILAEAAAAEPRLKALRVDQLPPGWLGKCHACYLGSLEATGEWLLFADGDVHLRPDTLRRAIRTAEREAAQHLCLWPNVNARGLWAKAAILSWGQCLALYCPASSINSDRGKRGVGIGAFNLIRASAYRQIGGHETLRLEVVDDVMLGQLVRRAGLRQRLYAGFNDVECEWAHGAWDVIKIVEKNWFAGMRYRTGAALFVIAVFAAMCLLAVLGPMLDSRWGWLALAGWLSTIGPALIQARWLHWRWPSAVCAPLGFGLFVVAGLNSTVQTLRRGGVRWRDTLYPLRELREGMIQ